MTQNQTPPQTAAETPVKPPASPAKFKMRHFVTIMSFVLFVLGPAAGIAVYLWVFTLDQYASTVAFTVRKEEGPSPLELLGGVTQLSGGGSSDTDILYEFIQSQKMVADLNKQLDLENIWTRDGQDPVFTYQGGTIEDLREYWNKMVRIYYDSSSGLIEIRSLAFSPEDAKLVATAIFNESFTMINELSVAAREDAVSYSREELATASEELKKSRQEVTEFRNRNQIVDPTVDLATQATLLGTLEGQLAQSIIDLDLLQETARENDPRVVQTKRRIEVISERIADEKRKLGIVDGETSGPEAFATLMGEYERLIVDREIAERAYAASVVAYSSAQSEARRNNRYLAAHIEPTLAERAEFPQRRTIFGLCVVLLFLVWSVVILVAYSLRDRR